MEFNRGCVDKIRIFRRPMAEARWPKGMFLIYRTVADFLFYQYNSERAAVSMVTRSYSFCSYDACWNSVTILRQVFWGNSRFACVRWYVLDRKKKEKHFCLCAHLSYTSYLRNMHIFWKSCKIFWRVLLVLLEILIFEFWQIKGCR